MSDCCPPSQDNTRKNGFKLDLIYHGSALVIAIALLSYMVGFAPLEHYGHAIWDLLSKMWWGVVLGIFFVGIMGQVPREYFMAILGRGDNFGGLLRAAAGGVLLDLCSHGILMVGAKLYERGTSLAQVMTFLIASPWNSFSLTLILIALIGLSWTLIFILGSLVIALISGVIFQILVRRGVLPDNPNTVDLPEDYNLKAEIKKGWSNTKLTPALFKRIAKDGFKDAGMILKWLLFGVILAAAIRSFVPQELFAQYFGPTLLGLVLTMIATTIIEVCSEGSSPIAAELVNGAKAPGNGFAFMMAGVSTDYTEIMILREFTGRWKIALFLPLVTLPQVMLLAWIMNLAAGG